MRARLLLVAGVALGGVLFTAAPASAHPLGNFSVNELVALTLRSDRIEVDVALDVAELPTLQQRPHVDTDGDGVVSDAERTAYAASSCAALASSTSVSVDGARLRWAVTPGTFTYSPGAAGLDTSRLGCRFSSTARLGGTSTVDVVNSAYADRVGWREITARGVDVHLVDPPVPATSVSGGLTAYPQSLLASPLNVRSARLSVRPGAAAGAAVAGARPEAAGWLTRWTAAADGVLTRLVGGRLTPLVGVLAVLLALLLGAAHAALPGHGKTMMAAYLAGRRGRPRDAVAVGATVTLTHTGGVLVLGLLLTTSASLAGESVLKWLGVVSGVLVAVVGASMLVGVVRRRGGAVWGGPGHHEHSHAASHEHPHAPRQVEHAHAPSHEHQHAPGRHEHIESTTHDHHPHDPGHREHTHAPEHVHQLVPAGSEHIHASHHEHTHAPEQVGHTHAPWPAGHTDAPGPVEHTHAPSHEHPHAPGRHEHPHGPGRREHVESTQHAHAPGDGHSHGFGRHGHTHAPGDRRVGRLGLLGMGIAGGLVPSPSAIVVLLGAIGLGRTGFGIVLVVAYGLGMAATLTAAGLLLVKVADRWAARQDRRGWGRLANRLATAAPAGTATLVLLVGLGLAGRAVLG